MYATLKDSWKAEGFLKYWVYHCAVRVFTVAMFPSPEETLVLT